MNSENKYFKVTNINPKHRITQDCVIRAISLFLDQDYYKTLHDLIEIYLDTGFHIADPVCFMIYLKSIDNLVKTDITENPFTLETMCESLGNKEFDKFPNITEHNYHKVLVLLGNTHLTYLENGVILDTDNHSTRQVSVYYTLQ